MNNSFYIIYLWFFTVETCDDWEIPLVDHGTYVLQRFNADETKIPPLHRQNFTIPGYVNVTYSCDEGYRLQDPNTNVIGCEYETKPRTGLGTGSDDVTAQALWTSTSGIACIKSETTFNKSEVNLLYSLPKLSTSWMSDSLFLANGSSLLVSHYGNSYMTDQNAVLTTPVTASLQDD